jgi:hypothetical protein
MIITEWARKWKIPAEALVDLSNTLIPPNSGHDSDARTEADVQADVREKVSKNGGRIWRNNCGVATSCDGRPIRFGLANDSKKINSIIKSSDLIGITPHKVMLSDVGKIVGVFTAYEVKKPGWNFTGTKREKAQERFLQLVVAMGGIGKFINCEDQI